MNAAPNPTPEAHDQARPQEHQADDSLIFGQAPDALALNELDHAMLDLEALISSWDDLLSPHPQVAPPWWFLALAPKWRAAMKAYDQVRGGLEA